MQSQEEEPRGTRVLPWSHSKHSQTLASGMTSFPFPIPLWQASVSRPGEDSDLRGGGVLLSLEEGA